MNGSSTSADLTPPTRSARTLLSVLALGIATAPSWPAGHAAAPKVSVTITLAGPNQWNSSGTSFGPPWNNWCPPFEAANPGVTLKTNVLPLTTFFQTEATLLQAGSAPELISQPDKL